MPNVAKVLPFTSVLTVGENPECPSDGQKSQERQPGKRTGMEIESDCCGTCLREILELNLTNLSFMFSYVGSVDQFQGEEFNVILMSTVRSNTKLTALC